MTEIKWIKITTDIFEDEKIKLIDSLPDADAVLVIWFKLLTLSGKKNNGGLVSFTEKIPYTDEMLGTIFNRPLNTVRMALKTFSEFEMIEITEDSFIYVSNWDKHQNIEGLDKIKKQNRLRQQKRRSKLKELQESNVISRDSHALDIEEDKEEDKNICDSSESPERLSLIPEPYKIDKCPQNDILKLWGQILPDLPQPRIWKGNRTVLLRARWNEDKERQNLEWWGKFFKYLRSSDFFMGKISQPGRRPFIGRLDWLLKSDNFIKTYEGKYHE